MEPAAPPLRAAPRACPGNRAPPDRDRGWAPNSRDALTSLTLVLRFARKCAGFARAFQGNHRLYLKTCQCARGQRARGKQVTYAPCREGVPMPKLGYLLPTRE